MNQTRRYLLALAAITLIIFGIGCSDRDPSGLSAARGHIDPLVFGDDYGDDVYFQAFFQTHLTAVSRDSVYAYGGLAGDGARSLKINIPPEGSSLGIYSGGVLTSSLGRDMADFNALTFYARANHPVTLNVAGFGNDNTGTSLYEAGREVGPLTWDWTFVIVPIPSSSKLLSERGLFTFAEGREELYPLGYDIWIDEIRFADLGNITNPRPYMPSSDKQYFVGSTVNLSGTNTTFDVDGADVVVDHMPGYFDFDSSDHSVATIVNNEILVTNVGEATITSTLDGFLVEGEVHVSGYLPPTGTAETPTLPASDVISLYSSAYADVPVDSWNPHWGGSTTDNDLYMIDGHETRMYSSLNFVGIDFRSQMIDASEMTHFHLDVYAPFGTTFLIKFGTFNENNGLAGEAELLFDTTSTPAFNSGGWASLEIPLEDFVFHPSPSEPWERIGQLVLSTYDESALLVLVDNIYWHK